MYTAIIYCRYRSDFVHYWVPIYLLTAKNKFQRKLRTRAEGHMPDFIAAVPNLFGLIPHLTLIYPPPPPPSPPQTRIAHASRRHKITAFNILLCIASVITVKPVIARLGDRL